MKPGEIGRSEFHGLRVNHRCEKIDGIPDAADFQQTVATGQRRHRDAAGPSASHSRGDRIRVDGKPSADLLGCDRKTIDGATFGSYLAIIDSDGHFFLVIAWNDLAEPAHASGEGEDDAERGH